MGLPDLKISFAATAEVDDSGVEEMKSAFAFLGRRTRFTSLMSSREENLPRLWPKEPMLARQRFLQLRRCDVYPGRASRDK